MDPITNMLNQIKNASAVSKTDVLVPFSRLKQEIAKILAESKFISEIKRAVKGENRTMKIILKYNGKEAAFSGFKRVSKPGQRIYTKASEIKRVKGGYGISIISTSKGLMTGKEAKKAKLGGEVICEIW